MVGLLLWCFLGLGGFCLLDCRILVWMDLSWCGFWADCWRLEFVCCGFLRWLGGVVLVIVFYGMCLIWLLVFVLPFDAVSGAWLVSLGW